MGRKEYVLSTPGFVVDPESVSLNSGRQIDWDQCDLAKWGSAGKREIPAGTLMVQLDTGLILPREEAALEDDGVTEIPATQILVASAHEDSNSDSLSGYGSYVGGVFYDTMLPDSGHANFATWTGELGSRFVFESYQDTRGS